MAHLLRSRPDGHSLPKKRQCSGPILSSFFACAEDNEDEEPVSEHVPLKESSLSSDDASVHNVNEVSNRKARGWTTDSIMVRVNEEGNYEEKWEFEPDAYSLGLCSLVQRGLARAWPDVLLAVLTPVLQLTAFLALFTFLMNQPQPPFTPNLIGIVAICLFLMSVNLVAEAVEGCKKVTFSYRCLLNIYRIPYNPIVMVIGIFLGFFQCLMTIGTFALLSNLLLRSNNILDVFLNFLSMSFLTEIDNTMLKIKGVQERARNVDFTFLVEHARYHADEPLKLPDQHPLAKVTVPMLVTINILTFIDCFIIFATGMWGEGPAHVYWEANWLVDWIVWAIWISFNNAVLWCGSRTVGTIKTLLVLFVFHQLLFWINTVYRYNTDGAFPLLWNPLLGITAFVLPQVWIPIGISGEFDALSVLNCPVRLPLTLSLLLVGTPFWMHQFMKYGCA